MEPLQFTLAQLAETLGAELRGDAQKVIYGLATLNDASSDQLSFLANAHYRKQLEHTQAGAMLLSASDAAEYSGNCLVVADPYL
ncbi:MAG TPA: LpxD N-terminal domain-containing protein, partial [Pseudomonadales bacterium]|nr:LpxD N-terminal domain-containing protein [Pseudomonadales bacterium]